MNTIVATPDGAVVKMGFGDLASFEFLQRSAKAFASSTMVPAQYQMVVTKGYGKNLKTEQNPAAIPNCMIALDMAQRLQANPLMIMQNLHIIEGRPSWSSQFIIASINSCGRFSPLRFDLHWLDEIDATCSTYEWIENQKTEKKHKVHIKNARCVAWAVERGTAIPQFSLDDLKRHGGIYGCCKHYGIPILESSPVTMEMAVNEGWYGKNGSKWRSMPDLMLQYRSAAFFGRLYAPELLMGLPTDDEVRDVFVQDASGAVHHAGQQPVPPSQGDVEVIRPTWADADWQAMLPKAVEAIQSGTMSREDTINWLNSAAQLTEAQETELQKALNSDSKTAEQQRGAPDAPTVDPERLAADLQNASDLETLYEHATLLDAVADTEQKNRLRAIFDKRVQELEQE